MPGAVGSIKPHRLPKGRAGLVGVHEDVQKPLQVVVHLGKELGPPVER